MLVNAILLVTTFVLMVVGYYRMDARSRRLLSERYELPWNPTHIRACPCCLSVRHLGEQGVCFACLTEPNATMHALSASLCATRDDVETLRKKLAALPDEATVDQLYAAKRRLELIAKFASMDKETLAELGCPRCETRLDVVAGSFGVGLETRSLWLHEDCDPPEEYFAAREVINAY